MRRRKPDPATAAGPWRKTILPHVDGTPTLGEVMDACERPYLDEITVLRDAWAAWLEMPDHYPSEDMLRSMSRLLELAWLELEEVSA